MENKQIILFLSFSVLVGFIYDCQQQYKIVCKHQKKLKELKPWIDGILKADEAEISKELEKIQDVFRKEEKFSDEIVLRYKIIMARKYNKSIDKVFDEENLSIGKFIWKILNNK